MKLSSVGKFLDQPLISNTLARKMPLILGATALCYGIKDTLSQPTENRRNQGIRNAIILGSITISSVLASKFIKIKGEKLIETLPKKDILLEQKNAITRFITKNEHISKNTIDILEKAKTRILSLKDTDNLLNQLKGKRNSQELISTLFGKNHNITSGEILSEISKLSIMGFVPVISGIFGGIAADMFSSQCTKEKTQNKIKEGVYQFFANIFLCNVGAGTFLFAAEKLNQAGVIKNLTPLKKSVAILAGILAVGVLGGSFIANIIGDKLINPLINKFCGKKTMSARENNERKPEALDIALHTDDIATAGVLSGVKWICPLLPVMYLVSGYRTAIGYRNCKNTHQLDKHKNQQHN